MNNNHENDGEHLFTFPFYTTDNSLMLCSDGLIDLNGHHSDRVRHEVIFTRNTLTDPVIITATSVRSLSPGVDINEDVINFCLEW